MTKNRTVGIILLTTLVAGGFGFISGVVTAEPSSQCLNLAKSATDMSDAYRSEDQVGFSVAEAYARSFRGSCS